jgi:hypothetical protein
MRHTHKFYLLLAILAGLFLSGCKKDFLDVNQDPNRVTDDNVNAELIFPAAAEGAGSFTVGARAFQAGAKTGMQFAQDWIGYMAANGDFARDNTETTYNIDFNFADNFFQTTYGVLFDLHQAEVKGLAGDDTAIAAASIILSAQLYQNMVDLFGNLPYSQAFSVDKNPRPAYDNAQDIYNSLQLRLDTAIMYMALTPPKKFAPVDIVNHGDTKKWIKYANTLKLRLLIRQSEVSGFSPAAEIAKIFDPAGLGILESGESVSVNPGYSNELNKQNPFYANYGYTPTNTIATTSTNANDYIINLEENYNDPRIFRFFKPLTCGGSDFVGDVYGDEAGNIPAGNASSYFGPALIGPLADDCSVTGEGGSQDQWLMPSYESLFFKAEAIARGWLTVSGLDAKTAYENAVKESFVWTGVPDAETEAEAYLTANADADWANAGSSPESQAKFIAFQKYLSNVGVDPLESYSDQRRLNFLPAGFISVNPSRVSNTLPLRLLYPQSEYTTNGDNVLKQGTINQFTSKLFWEP